MQINILIAVPQQNETWCIAHMQLPTAAIYEVSLAFEISLYSFVSYTA